jgi:hypothetical protein
VVLGRENRTSKERIENKEVAASFFKKHCGESPGNKNLKIESL